MQLGELIKIRAAEMGGRRPLPYRELSARAKAAGYALAEGTITDFANHPLVEPPRRRTMQALAVALDVSFNTILEAVAESMAEDGDLLLQVAEEPYVRAWVTLTAGRTDGEKAAMIDVVRAVAAGYDRNVARESAEPALLDDPAETPRSRNTRDVTRRPRRA